MMTNLVASLILALHTIAPNVSKDRIAVLSEDMVEVVQGVFDDTQMKSTMKFDVAVSMLAAVALHESGLRESVENCKISGDAGKSVGLTQIMSGPSWDGFSKKEICSSRKLQLRLGLKALDTCWSKTPNPAASLRCYASGDPKKDSWAARDELSIYKKISEIIAADLKKKDTNGT